MTSDVSLATGPGSRTLTLGRDARHRRPRPARTFAVSKWPPVGVLAVMAALALAAAPSVAAAAGRVALVVGNSSYEHMGRLHNPANDAADVSEALRRLGFDVTPVLDADRQSLAGALSAFAQRSQDADVALVFFAGHGMEINGVTYLIPVDAELERPVDVTLVSISLDQVLQVTEGASLRVVILDACRDNPLARRMRRSTNTRSISRGGLGELDETSWEHEERETLVAYAAAPGTTADEGTGQRNSPYTDALLDHLEEPVEINLLFRRVRAKVRQTTGRRQSPETFEALVREHYLLDPLRAEEEDSWRAIAGSSSATDFQRYLDRWPTGRYASEARSRLTNLRETQAWAAIAVSSSPADFEGYLQRWPTGRYASEARSRLTGLRDSRAWNAIAVSSSPADFEGYLQRWPTGRYASEARSRLMSLRDSRAWNAIARSTNPADFLNYRRRFPNGAYVARARSREAELRAAASPPRAPAAAPASRPAANRPASVPPSVPSASRSRAEEGLSRRLSALLGRQLSARQGDENRWTDLHYAAALNLPALVDRLSQAGAAVNARLKDDGRELVDGVRRTLRELERDLEWTTRDGETPLHAAASVDAAEAATRLLARGANVNARTVLDWTPLHYAAWYNADRVVGALLAGGAGVNARAAGDWTPLHMAAWTASYEAAVVLLEAGANLAARNDDDETPLEVSRSNRMRALLSRR